MSASDTLTPEAALAPATKIIEGELVTTTAQVNYTKEDLVDIAAVAAETDLAERLRRTEAALQAADQRTTKAREKLDGIVGGLTKGLVDEAVPTLQHAIDAIYPPKVRPKVVAEFSLIRDDMNNLFGKKLPKVVRYNVSLRINRSGNSYREFPPLLREMEMPEALILAHANWRDAVEDHDAAAKEHEVWQTAANNMPMFRRQLRAKLAAAQLSKSVGGRKVLSVLLDKMESQLTDFAHTVSARAELQRLAHEDRPGKRRR